MEDKTKTYLGFAIRAGKLTRGVNAVMALKERVFLLVADRGASENTRKNVIKLKNRFACPCIVVDDLEGLVGKAYCKLAAVRDEHLASALLAENKKNSDPAEGI